MICKKCGKENKENAKYCGYCGTKLKKKSKIKRYVIIGGIMLGALYLNNEAMIRLEPILYGRSSQNTEDEKATDSNTYKLNESFEIGNLTFNFEKTFTSGGTYELWQTTNENNVLSGFEGTVTNNSNVDISLSSLNVSIYYINGKGDKQQTEEPRTEFYAPSYSGDWFSSSPVVGAGQSGNVYMFLTPDKDCHALEMRIEDPSSGKSILVKNTFYCDGSYENADKTSFVRAASGYQEELACIQFYMNEKEYYGYIDKNGKMKFCFPSKYDDDICRFPTDFENGYVHYEYGDKIYTIDKAGNISSSYDDNYVSYGFGYTWIETDESGFDTAGYKYTLYAPNGDIETETTADEEVSIDYLGNGIFLYKYEDEDATRRYYFSKIHKWVDSYGDDGAIKVSENWLYDGCYEDYEQNKYYIVLYNSDGEREQVYLPLDVNEAWISVYDMSEKYLIFEANMLEWEKVLYVYDMEKKEFRSYSGKYADKIQFIDGGEFVLNDSVIVSMQGDDEERYIGVISAEDMSEIGEPIQSDHIKKGADVFSVWSDESDSQQIYNSEGTLLHTLSEEDTLGWIGGFSDNTMVAGYTTYPIQEDEYEEDEEYEYDSDEIADKKGHSYNKFMDYEGNSLFDSIDYTAGSEISF